MKFSILLTEIFNKSHYEQSLLRKITYLASVLTCTSFEYELKVFCFTDRDS